MRCALTPILTLILLDFASTASAQVSEGNQPYVPTRLEWLEIYLNAGKGLAFSPEHGYGLTYAINPHKDSLGIIVAYDPDKVSQEELEGAMANARRTVDLYVARKGWDNWLKIDERFVAIGQQLPPPTDDSPQPTDDPQPKPEAEPKTEPVEP
jgi:hypothetical protein